ncbi:SDR family oxidoreductase [Nonomuraea maritima]|uniref:SDR family oxidoreductase n=1 Tax=Nonomuraea maritima TaxID=683260 RepID=UPI00371E4394
MGRYEGKNVVITGGSSGLGLATARLLVNEGARVLITGRHQDRLDAARDRLGENAIAVRSDAASLSDIEALADRVKAGFGTVDALFANAGVSAFAPFEATSEEMFNDLVTINVKGTYFTVQKLTPLLVQGGGVVLTTSVANVRALPAQSAYSAGKAALRAMTRNLASELLPYKIRVNAISPALIDTGALEAVMPAEAAEQMKAQFTAQIPMLRPGTPDEVARAFAFLAFEATYTTGAELTVDGGAAQL